MPINGRFPIDNSPPNYCVKFFPWNCPVWYKHDLWSRLPSVLVLVVAPTSIEVDPSIRSNAATVATLYAIVPHSSSSIQNLNTVVVCKKTHSLYSTTNLSWWLEIGFVCLQGQLELASCAGLFGSQNHTKNGAGSYLLSRSRKVAFEPM